MTTGTQSKIVDYFVVGGNDNRQLQSEMLKMLKEGWQPYGSPFFGANQAMYQAVVKWASLSDTNPAPPAGVGTI